ncbi:hypothetical protein ACFQXA_00070 [Nocardiopsis composta]
MRPAISDSCSGVTICSPEGREYSSATASAMVWPGPPDAAAASSSAAVSSGV